jgi:imidazolonepropionase
VVVSAARGLAARRIATCGSAGAFDDGAVVLEGGRFTWVGPRKEAPRGVPIEDLGDRVITPGLVDAHTHAAWVGSRHVEYAVRMAGGDYRAIAAAGGGIASTMRAVAAATLDDIHSALEARLGRMAQLGVTCVEVKSGYGLEPELEIRLLAAIARAAAKADLPRVVPTFLALHALPERAKPVDARAAYVRHVAEALVPEVAARKLARFVDAYVDANAFTVDEARLVCAAAKTAGLGVRLHVGQFADVGGAELAAELGARSADHLEHVSKAGALRLAAAKTSAVLLPIASFTLSQAPPPIAELRAAGVPLVVASDANPGTAPSESLPLAMALAVRHYGLSPDEALAGATSLAARSLDEPVGVIEPGAPADLVVWDLPHEHAIVQPWGVAKTHLVLRAGRAIA